VIVWQFLRSWNVTIRVKHMSTTPTHCYRHVAYIKKVNSVRQNDRTVNVISFFFLAVFGNCYPPDVIQSALCRRAPCRPAGPPAMMDCPLSLSHDAATSNRQTDTLRPILDHRRNWKFIKDAAYKSVAAYSIRRPARLSYRAFQHRHNPVT